MLTDGKVMNFNDISLEAHLTHLIILEALKRLVETWQLPTLNVVGRPALFAGRTPRLGQVGLQAEEPS